MPRSLRNEVVLAYDGLFPSEEAALKVMYLALRNLIKKWERPLHWKAALNRFSKEHFAPS